MRAGNDRKRRTVIAGIGMAGAMLLPYVTKAQSTAPAAPVTTTAPTRSTTVATAVEICCVKIDLQSTTK